MRVFVQRYSAAGVQPQCFPIEIDTNGPINAAALKDIIASQLDQSLQDEGRHSFELKFTVLYGFIRISIF